MHAKNCPQCKIAWEEEETIYEFFLKKYEGDAIKAAETAAYCKQIKARQKTDGAGDGISADELSG